jgi:hypothetical protein
MYSLATGCLMLQAYLLQGVPLLQVSLLQGVSSYRVSPENKDSTAGYAITNDGTKKECYNEQLLSKKSGCYKEHRGYNERGRILLADASCACA